MVITLETIAHALSHRGSLTSNVVITLETIVVKAHLLSHGGYLTSNVSYSVCGETSLPESWRGHPFESYVGNEVMKFENNAQAAAGILHPYPIM